MEKSPFRAEETENIALTENHENKINSENYFNSITDEVILIGLDFNIININKFAAINFRNRFAVEVKKGDNILDILAFPLKEIYISNFNKAASGEEVTSESLITESSFLLKQTISFAPLKNRQGSIYGVIHTNSKKIIKKPIDDVNNETEYRLKLVLEAADVGWWDWNLITDMQYYDHKWWSIIGYEPNEVMFNGTPDKQIYHSEDADKIYSFFENALSGGQSNYELEYRMIHKNGHSVPVLSRGYILRNKEGIPIRISGTNMDLTEKKKIESLKDQSENYIKTIFENSDFGYVFIDENLSVLSFNQTALRYSENINDLKLQVGGSLLNFIKENRHDKLKSILETAFEGNKIGYERNVHVNTAQESWYNIRYSPVLDKNRKVANVIISLEDITERKRNELQQNKTLALVTAQNKRLMSFSYIVSHNLRSHSSNILSILDYISETEEEKERLEMIDHLKKASKSLDTTLNNLNDIISIHTNINLIFEPLILNVFIRKAIGVLNEQIHLKNANIINTVANDVIINYNPAYMESILLNLLSNAIKYAHPERDPIIFISSKYEKNKLVLLISDNGIGIDLKKNGDKIFGLYKTFAGNPDARGLGLFITRNQIEFMSGKITVESELGLGTTFKVYF